MKKFIAALLFCSLIMPTAYAAHGAKPAHGGGEAAKAPAKEEPATFPKGINSLKVYVKDHVGGKWAYQMYAKVYLVSKNEKYIEKQTLREKPGSDRYFAYFDKISAESYYVTCRENYLGFGYSRIWDRVSVDVMATAEITLDDSNGINNADISTVKELPVSRVLESEKVSNPLNDAFPSKSLIIKADQPIKSIAEKKPETVIVMPKVAKQAVQAKLANQAGQKKQTVQAKQGKLKVSAKKASITKKVVAKNKHTKKIIKKKHVKATKKGVIAKKTKQLSEDDVKQMLLKKGLIGPGPLEEMQPAPTDK